MDEAEYNSGREQDEQKRKDPHQHEQHGDDLLKEHRISGHM